MEVDDFIASLLLTKASVEFQEEEQAPKQVQNPRTKAQYNRLRQKAVFCKAPKSQKAFLYERPMSEVA